MDPVFTDKATPLIEPPHFLSGLYDQIVRTLYLPTALYALSLLAAIAAGLLWARRRLPGPAFAAALVLLPLVALALAAERLAPAAGRATLSGAAATLGLLLTALLGPAAASHSLQQAIAFNGGRLGDYGRIERYGAAAALLNTYMPREVTIATTEISSLFYYWRGGYLPLFATANRAIAAGGEPTGDLLFKKVSPEPMRQARPGLAFWDAVLGADLPLNYQRLFAEIELAAAQGADEAEITALAVFLFVHRGFVDEYDRRVGRSVAARAK